MTLIKSESDPNQTLDLEYKGICLSDFYLKEVCLNVYSS